MAKIPNTTLLVVFCFHIFSSGSAMTLHCHPCKTTTSSLTTSSITSHVPFPQQHFDCLYHPEIALYYHDLVSTTLSFRCLQYRLSLLRRTDLWLVSRSQHYHLTMGSRILSYAWGSVIGSHMDNLDLILRVFYFCVNTS